MDDAEFLKLLTHIHDEMLEQVKDQHPSHEQFAAWLLGQIEGRLRMRIGKPNNLAITALTRFTFCSPCSIRIRPTPQHGWRRQA